MMRKYRVTINGRNYLITVDGTSRRMGFYKTLFLEAGTPQEAEDLAVERIANDPKWQGNIQNSEDDRPVMYLESIAEIDSFGGISSSLEQGYVLYPEDDEETN